MLSHRYHICTYCLQEDQVCYSTSIHRDLSNKGAIKQPPFSHAFFLLRTTLYLDLHCPEFCSKVPNISALVQWLIGTERRSHYKNWTNDSWITSLTQIYCYQEIAVYNALLVNGSSLWKMNIVYRGTMHLLHDTAGLVANYGISNIIVWEIPWFATKTAI